MLELNDIADVVADAVREATAPLLARIDALEKRELVLPEKGEPGEQGPKGEPGQDGQPGEKGADGKDGVGLADALIDKDGNLVLTMTDGRTKSLGLVHGKDGENGRDGADGITPEFMDAEFVGRTLRLSFGDGERTKTVEFQMATPEYRGVFKEAETYEPGDMVTWAGSCWHCDEPKGLKPGAPDSGWTLAVKAGRPGKDK